MKIDVGRVTDRREHIRADTQKNQKVTKGLEESGRTRHLSSQSSDVAQKRKRKNSVGKTAISWQAYSSFTKEVARSEKKRNDTGESSHEVK